MRNVLRLAVENYNNKFEIIKGYIYEKHCNVEKKTCTVYDYRNIAFKALKLTGEILCKKSSLVVKEQYDLSIKRTKELIKMYTLANDFKYFVTLTFNSLLQDRDNDLDVKKRFVKFRRELKAKFKSLTYLAVPERHISGALHFHLLVGGVELDDLKASFSGHYTKGKKREIYNINAWKYGFSQMTIIENCERTSSYILKYIGKDLGGSGEFGKKRYWCSKNLNKSVVSYKDLELNEKQFCKGKRFNVVDYAKRSIKYLCDNDIVYRNNNINYVIFKRSILRDIAWSIQTFGLKVAKPKNRLPQLM